MEALANHIQEICNLTLDQGFKQKLKDKLCIDCGFTRDDNDQLNLKLNWIAKYMQIDGSDRIDYSKIRNKLIRDQLNRDCIEMTKHRLGQHNYTINFDEFCRYGQLQAEELINYY